MSNKSKDADPKQPDSSFIQLDDPKQKGSRFGGVHLSSQGAPRRSDCCMHHSDRRLAGFRPSFHKRCLVHRLDHSDRDGGRASSPRTPRRLARLRLRARPVPRIPSHRMTQKMSPRVRTTTRTIPSLQTRNRTKTRIARSPRTGAARSLAINPLPKIREPVILPMRLAVLLRAVASRLMEPHPLMVETPPRAARAAHRSPTTLR